MDSGNGKKHEYPRKPHRPAKRHSKEEKAERVRIKQQIRALRGVLPNGGKPGVVSLLREAIDYVKLLQSQVRAMTMRNSLQDGASTIGQCLQHPQFDVGPLEAPVWLATDEGMYFSNGFPGVGCYSSAPALHPSTAHHYLSGAPTAPWQHQVPTFPMHVTQLHHPPMYLQQGGPISPSEFCSVLADAWTWPHLHSLLPYQEAESQEEESITTVTTASTESS